MSVALQSAPCISELVNKPGPWSLMWQDLQLQRNRMYRTNILLMLLAPKFNGNPIGSAWLYPSFQAHLLAQAASSRKDSSNRRSLGVHLFQPRAAVTSGTSLNMMHEDELECSACCWCQSHSVCHHSPEIYQISQQQIERERGFKLSQDN